MEFNIDINGIDELERTLKDLQRGLSISVVKEWAKRIENEVNIKCSGNVSLEVKEVPENMFNIEVKSSTECMPFVIDSIERLLYIMPITTRELYKALIKNLKKGNNRRNDNL